MNNNYIVNMEETFNSTFFLNRLNDLYQILDDAIDDLSNFTKDDFRKEAFFKLNLLNISLDELAKLKDKPYEMDIKYEIKFREKTFND